MGEFPLSQPEITALRTWLRTRGMEPGPLFPSRNHRPITRKQLHHLMRKYCAAARIPIQKAHFHALKHSCGTYLTAHSDDIVGIQDHLGHQNIQNTIRYLSITSKRREDFGRKLLHWR